VGARDSTHVFRENLGRALWLEGFQSKPQDHWSWQCMGQWTETVGGLHGAVLTS